MQLLEQKDTRKKTTIRPNNDNKKKKLQFPPFEYFKHRRQNLLYINLKLCCYIFVEHHLYYIHAA